MKPTPEAIDCALQTAYECHLEASKIRQCKMFPEYARWLAENAKAAERWVAKQTINRK